MFKLTFSRLNLQIQAVRHHFLTSSTPFSQFPLRLYLLQEKKKKKKSNPLCLWCCCLCVWVRMPFSLFTGHWLLHWSRSRPGFLTLGLRPADCAIITIVCWLHCSGRSVRLWEPGPWFFAFILRLLLVSFCFTHKHEQRATACRFCHEVKSSFMFEIFFFPKYHW